MGSDVVALTSTTRSGGGQRVRWLLLAIAALCAAWAAAVALSGGFVLRTPWFQVSSHDPLRPLVVGLVAVFAYALLFRTHLAADLRSMRAAPWPRLIGAALVVAALVIGIQWGAFVAGGADSSGYVSQANKWLRGSLTVVAPEWAREATWDNAVGTAAPLGYVPRGSGDLIVPMYSPGLPLMMALFQTIGGPDAVYYVVPCLGAVAVWITFLLAARMAGPWAGVLGAVLLVASPTFLFMLVQPMSDLPAAALWGVAIWAAMRRTAVGAGAATALAIVVRPNLAPLGAVIALVVITAGGWRALMRFAAAAALGPVVVMLVNAQWYGSPFRSGYGRLSVLYSIDRMWPNLLRYGGWLLTAETPWMLLGLAAPLLVPRTRIDARLIALIAVVFPVTAVVLYLPYAEFDAWWYLRFLLPAFVPLLAAAGAVTLLLLQRLPFKVAGVTVIVLLVAATTIRGFRYSDAFVVGDQTQAYRHVADYVALLPPRAVMVSAEHSGSIRFYTGRDILRWDVIAPAALDGAVALLRQRGHDVYLVVFPWELEQFEGRFDRSMTVRTLGSTNPTGVANTMIYPLAGSAVRP